MASGFKDKFYAETNSYYALKESKFIRYNSPELVSIIAIDIDSHQDGAVWLDHNLPQPTWTIWTDRGVQFAWILNKPILFKVEKHKKMAKEVLAKLVCALDGDINALGFNRVFRNPFMNKSRFSDTRVDLKDFFDLPTPSQEWWDKVKAKTKREKKHETLFKDVSAPSVLLDFSIMKEGDGRNEALFNRLRFWSYDEARAGTYEEFNLTLKALTLNQQFAEGMADKELNGIIASIDAFMQSKYTGHNARGDGMSDEELKERASKAGKKSGAARKRDAYTKIATTIVQMESNDIKITVSDLARRAKCDRRIIREYLNEKGWREVSRKEGWKK